MIKKVVACAAVLLSLGVHASQADAGAFNFQEPVGWTVGDADSTFQEWNASVAPFSGSGTVPSASNFNPSLSSTPTMGVELPGFSAGSGGYYSFSGDYSIHAEVFNHGGSSGIGGPYPANYGTRVFVQTATTVNNDPNEGGPGSLFQDSLELVKHDGSPIAGGDNDSLLGVTQVFLGNVLTLFGIVPQQELVFEFWLPGYTGDSRIQFDTIIHSSFQHLRVDSMIMEAEEDADFDNDEDVDGIDFLIWQRDPDSYGGAAGLARWEQSYGTSGGISAITSIPEPASGVLLVAALMGFGRLIRQWQRHLPPC